MLPIIYFLPIFCGVMGSIIFFTRFLTIFYEPAWNDYLGISIVSLFFGGAVFIIIGITMELLSLPLA